MKVKGSMLAAAVVLGLIPVTASADQPQAVTITAVKAVHSATGTWSAQGAMVDSGTLATLGFAETALPAPDFVVTHVTYQLSSARGSFELRAQIIETVTAPGVLTDQGTWTITGLSGGYASLQGTGMVTGTVDHVT